MNRETIYKIVKASGIAPGELVLLHFWGETEQEDVLETFAEAVMAAGAAPLELRESRKRNQRRFAQAKETCFTEKYFSLYEKADAVFDIFVYQPVVLGAKLEDAQMDLYRKYVQGLFGAFMQAKRFLQIRIPTAENALETDMDPAEYIRRMDNAYDIDYDMLKKECGKRKAELKETTGIVLTTGEGHQLSIAYKDREWHVDAGDGDLPCGEVYVAPIEQQTRGEVWFEKLYLEDAGVFEDVVLSVEDGVVVRSSHPQVNAFLEGLEVCDRTVCELGFGMNPNVRDLCGCTVLDEKMHDTFHIAIGANVMFGGKNQASIHMDFVGKAKAELIK